MTTFTAEDLLYVAKETMLQHEWMLVEGIRGRRLYHQLEGYRDIKVDYTPEENSDQWRALAEYCFKHTVIICCKGGKFLAEFMEGDDWFDTPCEAMIAAVLTLRENNDG